MLIDKIKSAYFLSIIKQLQSIFIEMKLHILSQRVVFFCSIVTMILIHKPTSLCAEDDLYVNCSQTFDCSGHENLTYPFWGSKRPNYCGHPDFELNCTDDEPVITIESLNYRVVDLNQSRKSLVVARADYWENACPTGLHNISFDSSILSFASGSSQELTLYYKCPLPGQIPVPTPSLFICDINNTVSFNYFVTESIRSQLPTVINSQTCQKIVVLRISNSEVGKLSTNTTLVPALKADFGLTWEVNESSCDGCKSSGGHCGSDQNSLGEFVCYCKDGVQSSRCGSGGNSTVPKSVGLSIAGACILGICIGCLVYYLIQRKKKRAIQAKDKDIITPPYSKSGATTSNSFSCSIPSYTTSKSDLEKGSTYFGVQVFSYTELEEATDNFDPSKELGDGGFGTVYYGKLQDGRVVAVKRLYENNYKRVEQFMNEVEILTRLEHHNLVKLYGCTSRRSRELLLVYEYIPNGTVADHLHGKRANSGLLTWQVRLSIAMETADALAYLHHSDIIHRDVKTNNILLDNDFRVKVADFGLSRLFPNDVTHVSTAPQGTPGYVDPEYYQCYQLTDKSDVYSFGVVLTELISSLQAVDTNRHRLDINLASMAIKKFQNHALNEFVDPCLGFEKNPSVRRMTTAVAELAFRCLQQERDMRPSMEEVVAVLKAIKNEVFGTENVEVVDIRSDDVGLLKSMPPPLSPDSTDKWVSSSRPNSL